MPLTDYPPAELEPRHLTPEEIADPYQVISDLFSFDHLPEVRKTMWELMKLLVTGMYHKEPRLDRANLITLFEHLMKVVEAIHILDQRRKTKS